MTNLVKKILVVEDEEDISKMVVARLRSVGYEVITAANGHEGLAKVLQELPDLIITDVLMPIMDGFTFYKELKKNKTIASIPVLVLTARGKMEDSFRTMGVDDFLAKPFDSQDLLSKVETLLIHGAPAVKSSKKILVAGNDAELLEKMSILLKKVGCTTEIATNGPGVLTKVVQFIPDVVVLEVPMDDIPSQDLVGIMRKMPQVDKKPILIYSYFEVKDLGESSVRQKALATDTSKTACLDSGANAYIGRFNELSFVKDLEKYLA